MPDDAVITEGNAIVGFDFGAPTVPFINVPAGAATDAHEKPRRDRRAQDMMDHFFRSCYLWQRSVLGCCAAAGGCYSYMYGTIGHVLLVLLYGTVSPCLWQRSMLRCVWDPTSRECGCRQL